MKHNVLVSFRQLLLLWGLLMALFLTGLTAHAQTGWARSMGAGNNDQGNSIAVDAAGNVYTTGTFAGTVDFDPGAGVVELTSAGASIYYSPADIFVSKLDASGNLIWAKRMGGTGSDQGNSIAVDAAGNVYTTGFFTNTVDFDPGEGVVNLTSAGSVDIFVSKLDASGNYVWAKRMGGTGDDFSNSIAVDAAGNVYTTGDFRDTADFDPGTGVANLTSTSAGALDIFVSKLDASGNYVWAKSMGGTGNEVSNSIAVDATGNVYTTGDFETTADFDPGTGVANLTSTSYADIFVSKLDASGNYVWAGSMGGTGGDEGNSIAVDAAGNVYTIGYFQFTADFDPGVGVVELTSAGNFNIFVSKLDALGNFVWAKRIGGTSGDQGNSIAVDATGNVYTTGIFRGTVDFDPGAGVVELTSTGFLDIFVSKLDASGNYVWAKGMGGSSGNIGHSIAVNATGNVYVTGAFSGTVDFDPDAGVVELTSAANSDRFFPGPYSDDIFVVGLRADTGALLLLSCSPSVSIAANPGVSISSGTSVTFTATPTNGGTTPTYVWKKNDVTIDSETGATYTTTTLANNDKIKVVLTSNASCASTPTATSNEVTMTVCTPVTPSVAISASPSGSITTGTSVTFTATPTNGGTTPSYQWKKGSTNVGTSSATYTDAALANNDVITCVLTSNDACASTPTATSNGVAMTVTSPCAFVPQNVVVTGNGIMGFIASAQLGGVAYIPDGTLNDAPKWKSPNNQYRLVWTGTFWEFQLISNSSVIARNATGSATNLPCAATAWTDPNGLEYFDPGNMTLSGGCGSLTAQTVTPSVSIAANPSGSITAGTNVTFTATPTNGGATPSYQWKKGSTNVGTNSATYTDAALANNDVITCVLTSNDACASTPTATSSAITMTVTSPCTFTPQNITVSTTGCTYGGTFTPNGTVNGAPSWVQGNTHLIWNSSSSRWEITVPADYGFSMINTTGSITNLPCTDWVSTEPGGSPCTLLAISGGCGSLTGSTVTPSVSIAANPSGSITSATSVTFTSTPTNGGTTPSYQWKKGSTNVGTNSATYTDATLANGDVITCVMTSNATCASPTTATSNAITMAVTPACTTPTAYTVTGSGNYCTVSSGLPVGLSGSEMGVSYQLSNLNGTVGSPMAGTGSALDFGTKPAGTYTVVATRTAGECTATMTGSAIITVVTPPTANAGADKTTCGTTAIALAASGTGGWTGGAGSYSNAASPTSTYTPTLGEAGKTIILTWTVLGTTPCANATDQMTVTVVAPATANAGVDKTTCGTTPVALAAVVTAPPAPNLPQTGETPAPAAGWSGGAGSYSNATSPTSTYTPAAGEAGTTVTLTWTVLGTTPCANVTDQMTVTVVTPATANAGADKTTCGTTAIALAASGTGTWTGGAGSFSNAASPTSTYTPTAGEAGTIVTLTWTVQGTTPCANATDQMTVTIISPATANAGVDKTTCGTAPVALVATGTGTWTGGAGSFSNAASPTSTYTPTAGEAGTIVTLTWTVQGTAPCTNATDQMTVTVNPLPTATIAGSTTICQNTTSPNITFTGANGTAPYTFTYQINGGGIQTVSAADKNSSVTVAVSTANAGTFTYTLLSVSDANTCSQAQSGTATVTIHHVHTLSLSSATKSPTDCINTLLRPITFALGGGATGATVTGLPAGVTSSVNGNILTISGTPSVSGVFNYSIITTGNECATASESGTITLNTKPTFTLSVNQQTFKEGNNPTLCDTDANSVNSLQLTVNSSCVAGNPLWRVQIGSGAWSDWSTNAPSNQSSNNIAYKYQAACDAACPSTLSGIITLTINYRAATPQNVSLVADGNTVAASETKMICNAEGNALTFHATCGAGEILLYSVDGSEYSAVIPSQIVDNNFHNYRVRCRKADGTLSCVETESAAMSLKITTAPAAPTASISPTSGCGTPTVFSGNATCGTLTTIWYNATTNQALPTLPATTPNATTSYYARCQNEAGCEGEKSNVVTFTLSPVNEAPLVTVSAELVCAGTEVTISTNCPVGASVLWNTGVTEASFQVAFSNVTKASYSARCVFAGGCQSPVSSSKTVSWKGFELTFINVGQSGSATKTNNKSAWTSQFITPDAGPILDYSTEANPTIYYSENVNKTAPRFWTIHAETCNLGTDGSLTFNMLGTPEVGVIRSYNTHENNAPYFMYANREGFTELYAQNHPAYGFYQSNGNGGNIYDEGLPKGLYKLGVRYWDQKGQGSIYPSTRQPAGNILAYQEYWFWIQSKNGVGVGAARTSLNNDQLSLFNAQWAQVMPNPVANTLHLKVNEAKGQKVNVSLVDAAGRTMLQRAFVPETNQHQEEFEVSQLSTGIYFLRVNTADKQATLKVLKVE